MPAYSSQNHSKRPWTKWSGSNALTRPLNRDVHHSKQLNLILQLMHTPANHMMTMTQIPVQKKMMRVRVIYKVLLTQNRALAHILQSIGQIQVLFQEMGFCSQELALQD